MKKQIVLLLTLFTLIFAWRVQQIDGLNPFYKDLEVESLGLEYEGIRNYLSDQIQMILPQPQAALLSGMLLGVKSSLPSDFKKALTNTSTIHIVVVSGQNLTLVSGFILGFVSIIGRKKAVLLAMVISLFYALLTGFQVPVIRALIMVCLSLSAQLLNREADSPWILLLTASLMLIYNPNWILSISFQLSFLATLGVIAVAPQIDKKLEFMPEVIRQDLGVSLAAQLLTIPVIAANFHQLSLIGIIANSLVLFTIPFIMITGAFALLISLINISLAWVFGLIPGVFLTYFVYIIEFFNQKWGSLYIPNVSPVVWVGYYLLLFGLFLTMQKSNQFKKDKLSA